MLSTPGSYQVFQVFLLEENLGQVFFRAFFSVPQNMLWRPVR